MPTKTTAIEFDTVGDGISSTDPHFRWLGFGSDGEHLYFMELRTSSLHSVPFLEEGAEPTLLQEEAEYRGLENLIGDEAESARFWSTEFEDGAVLVRGPALVRKASLRGGLFSFGFTFSPPLASRV